MDGFNVRVPFFTPDILTRQAMLEKNMLTTRKNEMFAQRWGQPKNTLLTLGLCVNVWHLYIYSEKREGEPQESDHTHAHSDS